MLLRRASGAYLSRGKHAIRFHADYADGAEPFGAYHNTNLPQGVGATLCRPAAPRGANTHIPHGKHAKPVRFCEFCVFCVKIKFPCANIRHCNLAIRFHTDFTELTEPFGVFRCTNTPHGVGATLCRPVAPRGANIHTPHGKHAKQVRLCEFRAICVRTKYLRSTNNAIFHYAVPAYGPT